MSLLTRGRDYLSLIKPEIMLLVALTGGTALVFEGSLLRRPLEFALVILGLILTGGSANAFNQFFERDLDAQMSRTRGKRPLPLKRLRPVEALVFALAIGMGGVVLFGICFNGLSAVLAAATILFYSIFYTLYLKPRTSLNIVIGGAAGAMAPVIAWAAATGTLAWTPWILFAIVFFWTPPHFWSLALCLKLDYEKVKIPMLPLTKGDAETKRQMLIYALVMVGVSLTLLAVSSGMIYLIAALLLGAIFVRKAWIVYEQMENAPARGLFRYSIVYLMTLFVAMIADQAMR